MIQADCTSALLDAQVSQYPIVHGASCLGRCRTGIDNCRANWEKSHLPPSANITSNTSAESTQTYQDGGQSHSTHLGRTLGSKAAGCHCDDHTAGKVPGKGCSCSATASKGSHPDSKEHNQALSTYLSTFNAVTPADLSRAFHVKSFLTLARHYASVEGNAYHPSGLNESTDGTCEDANGPEGGGSGDNGGAGGDEKPPGAGDHGIPPDHLGRPYGHPEYGWLTAPPPTEPPPPTGQCCCAKNVKFIGATIPANDEAGQYYTQDITFQFEYEWRDWDKPEDEPCKIEWWEWNTDAKGPQGPPRTWTDHAVNPGTRAMMDKWKEDVGFNKPSVGRQNKPFVDKAGIQVKPGKVRERWIFFAVVLRSAKDCPCTFKHLAAFGFQRLLMKDGVGDSDKSKFAQGGIGSESNFPEWLEKDMGDSAPWLYDPLFKKTDLTGYAR